MLIQSIDMIKRKEEVMPLANKLADLVSTQQGSYTTHQVIKMNIQSIKKNAVSHFYFTYSGIE